MTDQERNDLRTMQDELLTIAYRRGMSGSDLIISHPEVTIRDFETMIYPKLTGFIRDLHRQYYPKRYT